MKKFKEKRIVNICNYITIIIMLLWLLCMFLAMFNTSFFFGMLLLPCGIPFVILSSILSNKSKYTDKFLSYMKDKLKIAKTLDELLEIEKEFRELCIEDNSYILSYPVSLKEIHREIVNKIDILQKQ